MIQASSLLGIKDPRHELHNVLGMHQYHQIIKYIQQRATFEHKNPSNAFTAADLQLSPSGLVALRRHRGSMLHLRSEREVPIINISNMTM
jgi:hypothetical protein